jgi:hypothetical protein
MKRIVPCFLFLFLLIGSNLFSQEKYYYVCLGSFTVLSHAAEYMHDLAEAGYETWIEYADVNGKRVTRILYAHTFTDYEQAADMQKQLADSSVIRNYGIRNLWIRQRQRPLLRAGIDYLPEEETARIATRKPKTASRSHTPESEPSSAESGTAAEKKGSSSAPRPEQKTSRETERPSAVAKEPTETTGVESDEAWEPAPGNPFKMIHEEGYANCVFSTEPIELGNEGENTLKKHFTYPEPVYARCYFPGPIGTIEAENFWHELWVDGKLRARTFFEEPPEPSWDQIQIWITEDEYKQHMQELGKGEHEIIIWVMKNEYHGDRAEAGLNAAGEVTAEMKEIWVPVPLSKGKFTYTVP